MAVLNILQEPNKILRERAREVLLEEIKSPEFKKLLSDMSQTLGSIDIGIGLAAPQVGKSLKIFLVSEEALAAKRDKIEANPEEYKKHKALKNWKHLVFINPSIIRLSREKELLAEGCLSVEKVYGRIWRRKRIIVEAKNGDGKKFRRSASGLFAQVIQHEMDHLEGILFIDKAEELQKISEKNE